MSEEKLGLARLCRSFEHASLEKVYRPNEDKIFQ